MASAIPSAPVLPAAMASALRGLDRSATAAAGAAARIAAAGSVTPAAEAPGRMPAAPAAAGLPADPAAAAVDLLRARRAYQANAAVLRTADDLQATAASAMRPRARG